MRREDKIYMVEGGGYTLCSKCGAIIAGGVLKNASHYYEEGIYNYCIQLYIYVPAKTLTCGVPTPMTNDGRAISCRFHGRSCTIFGANNFISLCRGTKPDQDQRRKNDEL